jgi:hypothetical protein
MRISGLGSSLPASFPASDSCGPNPCTWWDNIYARDNCIAFLQCGYPDDPTTIGFTQGVAAGAGAAAGGMASDVVGGSLSGLLDSSHIAGTVLLAVAVVGTIMLLRR